MRTSIHLMRSLISVFSLILAPVLAVSGSDKSDAIGPTQTANLAPIIGIHPVYRTNPGNAIALPIDATEPEGTDLSFATTELPIGAALHPQTGILSWIPTG